MSSIPSSASGCQMQSECNQLGAFACCTVQNENAGDGCGVAASAIAMDKFRAHMLAEAAGIRTARGFVVDKSFDQKEIKAKIAALDYPIFIKPLKAGSSFGISRIDVPEQISKVLIADEARGGNWFVDFKAGNMKYVVFRNKVLQYHIGNAKEKAAVCEECRKLGITEDEMNWTE